MKTAIVHVRLCASAQLNLIVGVPAGNNLQIQGLKPKSKQVLALKK